MERVRHWIEKVGVGRKIDDLGLKLKQWPHVRKIVYVFLILGALSWILMIPFTYQAESQVKAYYKSLGVSYEYFSVKVPSHYSNNIPDTITLEGIALYPNNAPKSNDGTVPAILQINGANNRKERNHDMSIQLVKRGMAVFIIEQRGHGESTGRATFYGEEPGDVPHVLDYLTEHYKWINSTHFGALGFSLGAGCLLIAQALDSRLYACSLFHPPTDISGIFESVDIVHITGSSLFQPPSYAPEGSDPMETRTAFYWCNASNTANVLMIQGDADTKVPAAETIRFYKSLDLQNRTDVQLIMRPGLGHEPNEADSTSRKYAIAWLLDFFGDSADQAAIVQTNLDDSIDYVELYAFNPPDRSILKYLAWIGMFSIEIGLLFYGTLIGNSSIPKTIQKIKNQINAKKKQSKSIKDNDLNPKSENKSTSDTNINDAKTSTTNTIENQNIIMNNLDPHVLFLQQMVFQSILILPIAIILGILNGFIDSNLLFGLFIELPIIMGVLFYISRIYYNKPNHPFPLNILRPFPFPAPKRQPHELEVTIVMSIFLIIPPIVAISIYDWSASLTLQWPVNIWKTGFLIYFIALSALFYVSHTLVEAYLEQHSYAGVIGLTFLWILGASQYVLFNPVYANFGNVTLTLILVFGFGFAMTFMGLFQRSLKKIFGKVVVVELLTAEIIAIILIENYMNIL